MAHLPPPRTPPSPIEETLHGRRIVDPYRGLEDASAPGTQAFLNAQEAYARTLLDRVPGRAGIQARLTELLAIGSLGVPQIAGRFIFHTRREGLQNQPVILVREGEHGADRPLVDLNPLRPDGTLALDWWFPSLDGELLAYGSSENGSEVSTLYVCRTRDGAVLPDRIERTRAASVAWKPDGSGFFYTRYPHPGEVPAGEEVYHRHVFEHQLGADPAQDRPVFGAGRAPQDWPSVALSEDGGWLLIEVSQGWSRSEILVQDLATGGAPVPVAVERDFLYRGEVFAGHLYLTTNEGAPRYQVFRIPLTQLGAGRAAWQPLIPESDAILQGTKVIAGHLVALYEQDASSRLRVFALDGTPRHEVQLPTLGTVFGLGGEWDSPTAFFGFHSYTVPPTLFCFDPQTGATSHWAQIAAPVDASPYSVEQHWCRSKDGTRVPLFLVARRGIQRDGRHPALLTGYGGFNVSRTPGFVRSLYFWLERGGIYADANLRGGGEYGEGWHRAGMLDQKQNTFDDFIAATEYLITEGYTSPERLAIQGGSNGGLLIGAAITQRPELFRAAVCAVPLLDMLRYHRFQIAKLWIPEYGSADDPAQFEWLAAYSPYHHVRDGVPYPAVLLLTGESDTRVDPMHARKMAARLQAASGSGHPILLRVERKAGHGAGKPITKQIEESTDIWAFVCEQLGVGGGA